MQPSQSNTTTVGPAGDNSNRISSTSSARGAIAPTRTRSASVKKLAAQDPNQPTLRQVFARAATTKPATVTSTDTNGPGLGPGHGPADALNVPSSNIQPPLPQPATRSAYPSSRAPAGLLSPQARVDDALRSNATSSAPTDGPWTVERVVVPFRASPAAATLTSTADAISPTRSPVAFPPPSPRSPPPPSPRATPPVAVASGVAVGHRALLQQQGPGLSSMPYSSQAITTTAGTAMDGSDASQMESHKAREGGHCCEGPSLGGSWPTVIVGATKRTTAASASASVAAEEVEDNSELEVLAVRLARLRVKSAAAVPLPQSAADTASPSGDTAAEKTKLYLKPLQQPQKQPHQGSHQILASSSGAGVEGGESMTRGSIQASSVRALTKPAAATASSSSSSSSLRRGGLTSSIRETDREKGWPVVDLVSEEPVVEIPTAEGSCRQAGVKSGDDDVIAVAPPLPAAAATAAEVRLGEKAAGGRKAGGGGGAAAATKPSSRCKAGAKGAGKAARSGKAPGGTLLWTEMSMEERAATGGTSWIRWEPLPPPVHEEADGAGGAAASAGPIFHLFSVDIETVDFMRGRQAFPRPDQVRLIEVAAVDLGPYNGGAGAGPEGTGFDPWVGPIGGCTEGRVFSTLVNCGRSFQAHKTIMHNGITWGESSAPGVPYTADALQRLFDFINQCCNATAAAAASRLSTAGAPAVPRVIPVLMAHNGTIFDFPVLRSECGRVGVEWPQDWWYFDTLLAAKVLWAKADWPLKPQEGGTVDGDDVAGEEGEEDGDEPGNVTNGTGGGGGGGAAKRSLSMDALKVWAGVTSNGQAHRAEVDAVDLAAVWRRLYEQWGRPSVQHLERLCSARGASKPAAGPMHRLGLLSLAAKADSLVRHMEVAAAATLSALPNAAAAAVPPIVLSPAQLRKLAEASRLHLRKPRGGGGGAGGFWLFEVLGEPLPPPPPPPQSAAPADAEGGLDTHERDDVNDTQNFEDFNDRDEPPSQQQQSQCRPPLGPLLPHQQQYQQQQQRHSHWQPSLAPFVVLLRGVKLRYMARASYAYKPDHTPKWELVLAAAGSGKPGSGGEGASSPEEVSELVRLMDGLARHASVQARGDAGRNAKLYSCGKDDNKGKAGKMSIAVQLHSQLSRGPALGQLRWEPLATLATYDKKTSSYRALPWPALESFTPAGSSSIGSLSRGNGLSQGLGEGQSELERIKEDNLARIAAMLPDVASNEVLDVAVWPEFCWVNNSGFGIRLKAVHLVRRIGR
ncbi:hypothetical protein Vretifemale_9537 [Volvox reticuliferus]|nr:hypothetical protein Vretifemale_9537 [Volvox reticuliferus]